MDLLSDPFRRRIMYTLRDMDSEITEYDEIIDEMIDNNYLRPQSRNRFEVQLQTRYFPRMADSGVIEYDPRSNVVKYVEDEDVEELLDFIEKFE